MLNRLILAAFLTLAAVSAAHAQDAYNAHGFTLTPGNTSTHDLLTVWGTDRQRRGECGRR